MDVRTLYIDFDNPEDMGYQLGKAIEEMVADQKSRNEDLSEEIDNAEREYEDALAKYEEAVKEIARLKDALSERAIEIEELKRERYELLEELEKVGR